MCGYHISDERLKQINDFLDEKQRTNITLDILLSVLTFHKDLELQNEQENEADEYLDAFVALGG